MFAVEVSSVCNLKCGFCSYTAVDRKRRIVPLDEYSDILSGMKSIVADSGKKDSFVALTGLGETFLISNITDYLAATRKALPGATIGIASNFTCIKKETMERIFREKLLDVLTCSLNYTDEAAYRDACGGDHFSKVIETIDDFAECRKKFGSGLKLMIGMKKKHGMSDRDVEDFEAYAAGRWKDAVSVTWSNVFSWSKGLELPGVDEPAARRTFPCYCLFEMKMLIDHKGDIYPCCTCFTRETTPELMLGNVTRTSYADLRARFSEIRRAHCRGEWSRLPFCSECNVYANERYDVFFKIGNRYF